MSTLHLKRTPSWSKEDQADLLDWVFVNLKTGNTDELNKLLGSLDPNKALVCASVLRLTFFVRQALSNWEPCYDETLTVFRAKYPNVAELMSHKVMYEMQRPEIYRQFSRTLLPYVADALLIQPWLDLVD